MNLDSIRELKRPWQPACCRNLKLLTARGIWASCWNGGSAADRSRWKDCLGKMEGDAGLFPGSPALAGKRG
jgi:hypothetical protein